MLAGKPAELAYKHERRAHRHRCRCCAKVCKEGDAVIMAKVSSRDTWVIHEACGDARYGSSEQTWREAMAAWSAEHKKRLGYK